MHPWASQCTFGWCRNEMHSSPDRWAPGDAVLPVVDARHLEAPVRFTAEEVVRVGEVLEVWKLADALGYLAGELVVRDVELLERAHVADCVRQCAGDAVETEVEHGELVQIADLWRDAGGDATVEKNQLVESPGHVADAARQAATHPWQVRQHDHRRRGVGEAVRQCELEVVVVNEKRVDLLVEDGRRHLAAEVRSCDGKGPESWLLLTSISWRRWRERRDSGRDPQKRLELRWKTARSDRRPSSSGSVPARSPWLRSTAATVRWHGSSGAGAQYTPK
ncbi:LOW QUALITY PROTEIN: hypothetical protein U9M48_010810 [Paspalum notatum var. saurae]|uniref:Uncharacterized protein n=1 Tax=Paspalum notatum var. saurae TaxID=547442 RepID=A0AAQ3STT4_PASNO